MINTNFLSDEQKKIIYFLACDCGFEEGSSLEQFKINESFFTDCPLEHVLVILSKDIEKLKAEILYLKGYAGKE